MLKAILIHTIFCRYPIKCFSKQHITHESVFFLLFSFMIQGSDKSLISDGPSFLWSSCNNVSCWIWHREKKSWYFIGYCSRKVYWKILHCRLRRISRNALTHVLEYLIFFFSNISFLLWAISCNLYAYKDAHILKSDASVRKCNIFVWKCFSQLDW